MTAPGTRSSYSLRFEEDGIGLPRRVEFEAATASLALEIAAQQCDGRFALLICEGETLCRIGHTSGTWHIAPVPPAPT